MSLIARPAARGVQRTLAAVTTAAVAAACASSPRMVQTRATTTTTVAAPPAGATSTAPNAAAATAGALPPDAAGAAARLAASPRHGEYAMIRAGTDSVRAWVVYPERATKAPVVVVVHEIFGLSTWVRGVADQLAADGFIAVAPDLLTGYPTQSTHDDITNLQGAMAQVSQLDPAQVQRRIAAAGAYGMALPAAQARYGVVGFCWGGSASFQQAAFAGQNNTPGYSAGVVYYGGAPAPGVVAQIKAPVLGLFAGNDARVNATLPPADSTLRATGQTHEFSTFGGAGHGFLRQQSGGGGANLTASQQAWPRTVAWFKRYLES